MGDRCSYCGIPSEPRSLRDALEFCSRLSMCGGSCLEATGGFYQQIKKDVSDYYYYEHDFDKWNGSVAKTIRKCHEILENILGNAATEACGTYTPKLDTACVAHCAITFEKLVPELFGALYFVYFMCNRSEFAPFGGGWWSTSNTIKRGVKLKRWLTEDANRSCEPEEGLTKRGFKEDEIKGSVTVESLVSIHRSSDWPIGPIKDGYLQRLMVPMIFRHGWHRGKTAHTLLFLKQFTHQLDDGTLKDYSGISNFSTLLNTCKSCSATIQILFEKLYPVCKENTRLYHGTLRTDEQSFNLYYNWIKDNIVDLIESLNEMQGDCKHWNEDNLSNLQCYGPFPWGFIFIDRTCESGQSQGTLATIIDIVIVDLHKLSEAIHQQSIQMASTGERPQSEGAASPSSSGYGTRIATTIAIGALFFSICYVLNL